MKLFKKKKSVDQRFLDLGFKLILDGDDYVRYNKNIISEDNTYVRKEFGISIDLSSDEIVRFWLTIYPSCKIDVMKEIPVNNLELCAEKIKQMRRKLKKRERKEKLTRWAKQTQIYIKKK